MATSVTVKELDDKPELVNITKLLGKVELDGTVYSDLIDTTSALSNVLDALDGLPTQPPSLYIDLEGENLSREGTVSILQLYVLPTKRTYLIDIHTLRNESFTAYGSSGRTLKEILESPDIPKVFFDVRNDSDALYSHFNIHLAGIQDLQLMELATRTFARRHVNGLAKCIERDGRLSVTESNDWKECKEKGVRLFAPEHGGSYKVFNERPLPKEIVRYCIQDVHFLPRLWTFYNRKLTSKWWQRVKVASTERVAQSQSTSYVGHGRQKALAPAGWLSL
uniref:3'-5' exonuclease domain-containing protein n=1 Tax=Bionectria ochroleuca TaxID=29856 RepID=A0A8H7N072_BIOOC